MSAPTQFSRRVLTLRESGMPMNDNAAPDDLDEPDDDLPEAVRLHAALAVACLALRLIADDTLPAQATARATLDLLRRKHPDAREHLPPE